MFEIFIQIFHSGTAIPNSSRPSKITKFEACASMCMRIGYLRGEELKIQAPCECVCNFCSYFFGKSRLPVSVCVFLLVRARVHERVCCADRIGTGFV